MEDCRQFCKHAKCRLRCSEPCAPCQEPCGWSAFFFPIDYVSFPFLISLQELRPLLLSCPLWFGQLTLYFRLLSIINLNPIDMSTVAVRQIVQETSEVWPSMPIWCVIYRRDDSIQFNINLVCGEDCEIQICPQCASANQKTQVVDLILQRSLEDVLPESGDIDEMIITIPACRHVFTVETLDGLTGMKNFYSRDEQDMKWKGLLAPLGFTMPPTCPTCRSPITCPRYGRIVKRADLDILERNVAAHMSQSLDKRQQVLQDIKEDVLKELLSAEAAKITIPDPKAAPSTRKLAKQKNSRRKVLEAGNLKGPASERDIQASNPTLHFMESNVLSVWRKATHRLFAVYRDIVKITECRYAHTQAWEASFSLLYQREIEAGLENPSTLSTNPRKHAMEMARINIGQSRPLADRRFLVEAFWITLHIRLTLIDLAQTWMGVVSKRPGHYPAFHLQQWVGYIDFLLQTCVRDAEKAYDIARDSESHRQIVKSRLLLMRIHLEVFRFNLSMCRHYGTFKRKEMLIKVENFEAEAQGQMEDTVNAHLARIEFGARQQEEVWVQGNFTCIAKTIISEWTEMKQSIKMDTFYQPLSLHEQMQIVRAMNFGMLKPELHFTI